MREIRSVQREDVSDWILGGWDVDLNWILGGVGGDATTFTSLW